MPSPGSERRRRLLGRAAPDRCLGLGALLGHGLLRRPRHGPLRPRRPRTRAGGARPGLRRGALGRRPRRCAARRRRGGPRGRLAIGTDRPARGRSACRTTHTGSLIRARQFGQLQVAAIDRVLAVRARGVLELPHAKLRGAISSSRSRLSSRNSGEAQDRVDDRAQNENSDATVAHPIKTGSSSLQLRVEVGPGDQRQVDDDEEQDEEGLMARLTPSFSMPKIAGSGMEADSLLRAVDH